MLCGLLSMVKHTQALLNDASEACLPLTASVHAPRERSWCTTKLLSFLEREANAFSTYSTGFCAQRIMSPKSPARLASLAAHLVAVHQVLWENASARIWELPVQPFHDWARFNQGVVSICSARHALNWSHLLAECKDCV